MLRLGITCALVLLVFTHPAAAGPGAKGAALRNRLAGALERAAAKVRARPAHETAALPAMVPTTRRAGYRKTRSTVRIRRGRIGGRDKLQTTATETWNEALIAGTEGGAIADANLLDVDALLASLGSEETPESEARQGMWANVGRSLRYLQGSSRTTRSAAVPLLERLIADAPTATFSVSDTRSTMTTSELSARAYRDKDSGKVNIEVSAVGTYKTIGRLEIDPSSGTMTVTLPDNVSLRETRRGDGRADIERTTITTREKSPTKTQRRLDDAFAAPAAE